MSWQVKNLASLEVLGILDPVLIDLEDFDTTEGWIL